MTLMRNKTNLVMCVSPVDVWIKNKSSLFPKNQRFITVPCGKCPECRVNHSKEWAVRCLAHYQALSDKEKNNAWFITLTYDNEHCPFKLNPDDMVKFWKRLRKANPGCKIKYFMCGEYGTRTYRPHYHAIVYGLPINDLKFIKQSNLKDNIFTSETISKIWGNGIIAIGSLTLKSCSYVARYTLKKVGNTDCFQRSSNGFGLNFYKKYKKQIIQNGYITLGLGDRIMKAAIPRYFTKKMREEFGEDWYIKWFKHRMLNYKNNEKLLAKFFKDPHPDLFNAKIKAGLGVNSYATNINNQNRYQIRQALYDLYQNRENMY